MVYFLKGKSMGYSRNDSSKDPEYQMIKKITEGTINDAEIETVVNQKGDALKYMEKKADALHGEMKHVNRKWGEGAWDGIDNDGNLYKDSALGSVGQTEYSKEAESKIKPLIEKENG